jgi:hypothetical protein
MRWKTTSGKRRTVRLGMSFFVSRPTFVSSLSSPHIIPSISFRQPVFRRHPSANLTRLLANILPPPDDLTIPIVKLLNHPTYRAYQANTAALSLIPRLHLRFQPPAWGAPTPPTPRVPVTQEGEEPPVEGKEKKEWKRRIKMYSACSCLSLAVQHLKLVVAVGPALEAFGFERLIFGSAPSSVSSAKSSAGDWYELARESLSELGVEQGAIDAVFMRNARKVYGAA